VHPLTPDALLQAWESVASVPRGGRDALLAAELSAAISPDATPPAAGYADLPLGALGRTLARRREALFGDAVDALTECPRCGTTLELTFGLREVLPPADDPRPALVTLESDGVRIDARLLTSSDLVAVSDSPASDKARAQLLERSIVDARDDSGKSLAIRDLPDRLVAELAARMEAVDPGCDVELSLTCATCGHEWEAPFDIGQFLWGELDAAARRLLVDVHDLAVTYGWSEREILSLSADRRAAYLEMVRA